MSYPCGNRNWRLCEINGACNGVLHIPTWTIFKIEEKCVEMVRTRELNPPSDAEIEALAKIAFGLFHSRMVSKEPFPMDFWPRPVCRPRLQL